MEMQEIQKQLFEILYSADYIEGNITLITSGMLTRFNVIPGSKLHSDLTNSLTDVYQSIWNDKKKVTVKTTQEAKNLYSDFRRENKEAGEKLDTVATLIEENKKQTESLYDFFKFAKKQAEKKKINDFNKIQFEELIKEYTAPVAIKAPEKTVKVAEDYDNPFDDGYIVRDPLNPENFSMDLENTSFSFEPDDNPFADDFKIVETKPEQKPKLDVSSLSPIEIGNLRNITNAAVKNLGYDFNDLVDQLRRNEAGKSIFQKIIDFICEKVFRAQKTTKALGKFTENTIKSKENKLVLVPNF